MSAIVMSVTFCYVDLGLTSRRVPIILGVVLGTLGVLERIAQQDTTTRTSTEAWVTRPS